jgi:hypothetical protein
LTNILQWASYNINIAVLKKLTKFCYQCQIYKKSPGRFKFTLKDDYKFNYSVIIDIIYLNGKPILQIVDSITAFRAARFLKDILAYTA